LTCSQFICIQIKYYSVIHCVIHDIKSFRVKILVEAPSHTKVNIAVLGFVACRFTYWKVKW
jgi:hypothetical protein